MRAAVAALAIATLLVTPLRAQMEEHHHESSAAERLGTVSFPISCAPGTQEPFTRAVALLHSFWYEEAEKAFRDVAARDPRCGIAWWGVAMSNYHQVWPTPYSPAELARGVEAASQAVKTGGRSPREQGYIDAIAVFYRDAAKVDLVPRARSYEAAMEQLVSRFPDDDEAKIFYALALVAHGMSTPTDKTYAYQKKAATILNGLLERHPDHPGIAHYLIHSFDYPALAPMALNAAYAYAKIAPSSPHALHMPSHIFVRLGMWQETIDSNLLSAKAARDHAARTHPGSMPFDALHADDYLAYAWLQRGEDEKVHRLVADIAAIHDLDVENFAGYYAIAAIPARDALERRDWKAAMFLTPAAGLPWDRYPYAEAIVHFAHGVGAARSGDLTTADADVARLDSLQRKLRDQHNAYWADQVEIQRRTVAGWIAHARHDDDEAIAKMGAAADLEDSMDKSPVTPGAIVPAREMFGDLLLEMNQPEKALAAYERSLRDSPNRLNGLSGAARAAQLAGDRTKAATYYVQVGNLLAAAGRSEK